MRTPHDGLYRARWIVPVASDPIHGGFIRFERGRVVSLGRGNPGGVATDLGDVAMLPGLVNSHTHLEFSDCPNPIGRPGMPLAEWVADVVRHRAAQAAGGTGDCAVRAGLSESAASGVVLVGEIASAPRGLVEPRPTDPDMTVFAEVLGVTDQRQQDSMRWATGVLRHQHPRQQIGLSPHAPYSTPVSLLRRVVDVAMEHQCAIAMHVAESRDELQLMSTGEGPFRDALERIGVWREGLFPDATDLDGILNYLVRAPRCLLIHGNYLTDSQIDMLAPHSHVSVVYCPRTHHFFAHARHPILEMRRRGLRVVLGTDSRASNPDLSVWNEGRFLFQSRSDIDPRELVRMMTIEGAAALGHHQVGWFGEGASPGMITVPTSESEPGRMFESLFSAQPDTVEKLKRSRNR